MRGVFSTRLEFQLSLFSLVLADASGFFVGCLGGRHFDLAAAEELLDGVELQAGVVFIPEGRGVVACGKGFAAHVFGGFFQADEDPQGSVLALDRAAQVSDELAAHFAGFYLHQGGLELVLGAVEEGNQAIHAMIFALFAGSGAGFPAVGTGADQRERPPLELVAVVAGEVAGGGQIDRLTDDKIIAARFELEGITQAVFLQIDRQVGDIDADPAAVELLTGSDGCPAAAEGVKTKVAGVAAGQDDTLQQGEGLLGWVAEFFASLG